MKTIKTEFLQFTPLSQSPNILVCIVHVRTKATEFSLVSLFVYLFIHSVTHVTLDTSITDYNLYITAPLIIYEHPHNTI